MSVAPHEEMACQELVEVITDYLEGDMPATERARFEAHLEACPDCVNYLEQMRGTIATLGGLSEESLSPEVPDQLLRAFLGWAAGR